MPRVCVPRHLQLTEEVTPSAVQRRLLEALFVKQDDDRLRRLRSLCDGIRAARAALSPEYLLATLGHLMAARVE